MPGSIADGPPPATSVATSSRWKRGARWAAGGLAGAFLAGAGGAVWQATQDGAAEVLGPGAVALNVHVDPAYWKDDRPDWTPYFYYLPVPRPRLTEPPADCRDRRPWAWAHGGADADETRVAFTLTGRRSSQVSLEGMSVEVLSRTQVSGGSVAACPVGGASASVRGLEVDLDAETVRFVDAEQEVPARITLDKGETEAFDLYAMLQSPGVLVEWRLRLSIVDGEDRREVLVDDGGRPFRTVGTSSLPMTVWEDGGWRPYDP